MAICWKEVLGSMLEGEPHKFMGDEDGMNPRNLFHGFRLAAM